IYTISMIAGFIAMGFAGSLGERKNLSKQILLIGVFFFILSYLCFTFSYSLNFFIFSVIIFFIGFNLHEPIMQSCASKFCKVHEKGVALGIFNSFGYGGSFIGGILGGLFLHFEKLELLTIILVVLSVFWFILLLFLKNPAEFKNIYLNLNTPLNWEKLLNTKGVIDIYKNSKNLVIKFDNKLTSKEELEAKI
ncbi:MFS transporter, partial [Campylobacter sp. TTU-622]